MDITLSISVLALVVFAFLYAGSIMVPSTDGPSAVTGANHPRLFWVAASGGVLSVLTAVVTAGIMLAQ